MYQPGMNYQNHVEFGFKIEFCHHSIPPEFDIKFRSWIHAFWLGVLTRYKTLTRVWLVALQPRLQPRNQPRSKVVRLGLRCNLVHVHWPAISIPDRSRSGLWAPGSRTNCKARELAWSRDPTTPLSGLSFADQAQPSPPICSSITRLTAQRTHVLTASQPLASHGAHDNSLNSSASHS